LRTNGASVYWAPGGGSTTQYITVVNANALFATKAYAAANSYVKSVLANTNSYIRSQLANTNSAISNVKTGLTSTNTALRTLISDRLQVANAATLYTTKSNPTTSGLLAHTGRVTISTNLAVTGNTVIGKLVANGSLGTSGYALKTNGSTVYWDAVSAGASPGLVSLTTVAVKDLTQNDNVVTAAQVVAAQSYLQVANAVALYTTKSNPTTSGLLAHTGRATISTNLTVSGNTSTNKATVTSALTVSGNTTLGASAKTISTTGLLAHTGRATISTNLAVTGNTVISAATTSGNNATGALLVTGGIGVSDSLYVKSRIGIANTSSVSVVYMTYNNTTKSLDTTFG
jgi:hypothetical protein